MLRRITFVAVAGALLLPACSSEPDPEPTPDGTAAPTSQDEADDGIAQDTRDVVVYVDGWSVATADTPQIDWQTPDGATGTATLEPLDEDAVEKLLADTPDAVQRLAARMITPVPQLRCGPGLCTVSVAGDEQATFTAADIATLGDVPLADVYDAWQVTDGIFRTVLEVPETSQQVDLTYAQSRRHELALTAGDGPDAEDTTEGESEQQQYQGDALAPAGGDLGYGKDTFVLSYAFGELFYTTPAWLDTTVGWVYKSDPPLPLYDTSTFELEQGVPEFTGGLNVPVEAVQTLADAQLTWLSSPTGGCEAHVLCVPQGGDIAEHEVRYEETGAFCFPGHADGVPAGTAAPEGAKLQATLAFRRTNLTFDLDRPTHQAGWGDSEAHEKFLEDATADPALISEPQSLEVFEQSFFHDNPPQLFQTAGNPTDGTSEEFAEVLDVYGTTATC